MISATHQCSRRNIRPVVTLLGIMGKHQRDIPALQPRWLEYKTTIEQHLADIEQQLSQLEGLGAYIGQCNVDCTPGEHKHSSGQVQLTAIRKITRALVEELGDVRALFAAALLTAPQSLQPSYPVSPDGGDILIPA